MGLPGLYADQPTSLYGDNMSGEYCDECGDELVYGDEGLVCAGCFQIPEYCDCDD